jgi:hypothetical protein
MTLLWEAFGKKRPDKPAVPSTVPAITTRLRSIQEESRCKARTRVGRPCRCRRAPGSEFCNFHDPVISARIREQARLQREEKKRMLAALPDGYSKPLYAVDGIPAALDTLYREVRLGVVSPRTAGLMLAIVDRLLVYDKLVGEKGPRRVSKKLRIEEVRAQLQAALEELQLPAPARPVRTVVANPVNPAPSLARTTVEVVP